MAFDYTALHTAIKGSIVAAGFFYVEPQEWGNFDEGEFNEALDGKGFAIILGPQGISRWEDGLDRAVVFVTVEFILETGRDIYLTQLSAATAAIKALADLTGVDGLCAIYDDPGITNFNSLYLLTDTGQGKGVFQFPNIQAEIQ